MEEEASKKASEAAKRQRDLKKFGKQVQVSKIQEREKQIKDCNAVFVQGLVV